MNPNRLDSLLAASAAQAPNSTAIVDPGKGEFTFAELNALALEIQELLRSVGVGRNDRVGICVPKSIGAVASIFASLSCDACYVPVDPGAPAQRSAYIFSDCSVKAVLIHAPMLETLQPELAALGLKITQSVSLPTAEETGIELAVLAMGLAFIAAVPLGILSAVK